MPLFSQIATLRTKAGLSIDELAKRAGLSKTYIWELENDKSGTKKPSADVLLKIARTLSTSIAILMELPSVQMEQTAVEISSSLQEFADRMKKLKTPLSQQDLHDLATMKFRGGQPQTADEWNQLYFAC